MSKEPKQTQTQLLCGAAMEKITPPAELLPDLFGLVLTSFDRIYDDLYVRVIALRSGGTCRPDSLPLIWTRRRARSNF